MLSDLLLKLNELIAVFTGGTASLSKVTSVVATVANAAALSDVIDIRGYQVTGIVIPAEFDGTTIGFQVSADGVTYQVLYDMNGDIISLTVSASRSYALWSELSGWAYIKVTTGTNQTGATAFTLQLNSER